MSFVKPIIAFIFLCGSLGALAFVYLDIQSSAAAIVAARNEIAAVGARDNFAKAAAQFLLDVSKERASIESLVVGKDQTATAIVLVEEAAKLAGVDASIASAAVGPTQAKHLQALTVVVSAEGSLRAHANFSTVLESLPKGAYLKSATLEAADKGWFGTYTVVFVTREL